MRRSYPSIFTIVAAVALSAALAAGAGAQTARAAPDFSLPAINGGQKVQLSAMKGTPVVLLFWAAH